MRPKRALRGASKIRTPVSVAALRIVPGRSLRGSSLCSFPIEAWGIGPKEQISSRAARPPELLRHGPVAVRRRRVLPGFGRHGEIRPQKVRKRNGNDGVVRRFAFPRVDDERMRQLFSVRRASKGECAKRGIRKVGRTWTRREANG